MFGLFEKKPALHYTRLDDVVWLNSAARQRQVVAQARKLAEGGACVFLCTHSMSNESNLRAELGEDTPRLRLGDAMRVSAASLLQSAPANTPVRLMVAEFGSSLATDEQLLQRVNDPRLKQLTVEFHASMDDAVLRPLLTPKVLDLFKSLGVSPDEPLRHQFITRAIANARAKAGGRN